MSYARRISVTVTTDGSGDAEVYLPDEMPVLNGLLDRIIYTKDDFADTVDFSITLRATGEELWVEDNVMASAVVAPRQATHDPTGTAALYAAGGKGVLDRIAIGNDQIKIVISNGGAAKSGTFTVVMA